MFHINFADHQTRAIQSIILHPEFHHGCTLTNFLIKKEIEMHNLLFNQPPKKIFKGKKIILKCPSKMYICSLKFSEIPMNLSFDSVFT